MDKWHSYYEAVWHNDKGEERRGFRRSNPRAVQEAVEDGVGGVYLKKGTEYSILHVTEEVVKQRTV